MDEKTFTLAEVEDAILLGFRLGYNSGFDDCLNGYPREVQRGV